jgi:predicted acyl esterase
MSYSLVVDKDVSIPLRDGEAIVADVFRPAEAGTFPVIITLGPYPKDVHFSQWNPVAWVGVPERGPYMHWETVNPEWWVPLGYVVIRCDTRGTGKSPGMPRLLSRAEAEDFYDAVEWAARCHGHGRVAVMGISYFAMNAWRVAALQPPHLAAIVPWKGGRPHRDAGRHGASIRRFPRWGSHAAINGRRRRRSAPVPPELYGELHTFNPNLATCGAAVSGNWGGAGRTCAAASRPLPSARRRSICRCTSQPRRSVHSLEGRLVQLRFLEQFLRGVDTGITREPPIRLAIRHDPERYRWRYENEWPLARTEWIEWHLDAAAGRLVTTRPAATGTVTYDADPVASRTHATFTTDAFGHDTEITGPVKLRLWVSSSSDDADVFAIVRKLGRDGREVTFPGPMPGGSQIAVAYGWLRVSHRKLDASRSTPWRPFHTHDEIQKLQAGAIVPLEVEIWPTSIVVERGERLVLEVGAKDDPRSFFQHDDRASRTGTKHSHGEVRLAPLRRSFRRGSQRFARQLSTRLVRHHPQSPGCSTIVNGKPTLES